jgi:hypothetical protein
VDRPHPPEIREVIAELVRDYHPTEVRNFQVERISADRAVVTCEIPNRVGEKITREVYFEQGGV